MASTLQPTPAGKISGTARSVLERKGWAVFTIGPDAWVYDAVARMDEHKVGALFVVVDSRLVGVISERDYARKVILKGRSSAETPVWQIMSSPVVTVTPEDGVRECMQIMTEKRIRHLPVLHDGRMVGVISIGDLVRAVIEEQDQTIEHLERFIAG